MQLTGTSLIGSSRGDAGRTTFHGVNPETGEALEPAYHAATPAEVDRAAQLATEAAIPFGQISGAERAAFLRAIADQIESVVEDLVQIMPEETALPEGRVRGEAGRTLGQLRLFATLVEDGSWQQARIDHADPDREPFSKPDVRSVLRPLGPVAVFGASNFPLAFGVAGGDTTSALAAGNPVIVKAHPAHPRTCEIVGTAITRAVQACGLPEGVFSMLFDAGIDIGVALVKHPAIRAVGFTGSLRGGRALMDIAAARPEPIPVFAEMGSVNPVFLLPGALRERGSSIAEGLTGSVNLGAGQFCTNPGLVVAESGSETDDFARQLTEAMQEAAAVTLLTEGIAQAYAKSVSTREASGQVETLTHIDSEGFAAVGPALFRTTAEQFVDREDLGEEIFGPSSLLVTAGDRGQLIHLAESLQGQLTACVHGSEEDLSAYRDLIDILERKAGRVIFNGYPTGVEVCHAMVHGGPYPATSDSRSTSVGTLAIFRFARPVAYQDFPDAALPPALQESNPEGIRRLVDGDWQ